MKRVIIFGSTGSIGMSTVKVLQNLNDYKVVGLAAFSNFKLLMKQAKIFEPEYVAIIHQRRQPDLKGSQGKIKVLAGEEGLLCMIRRLNADILVAAFSSAIGIYAVLEAIKKRMRICLATKEILVSFGEIVMKEIRRCNAEIIPIDSEHSAVYQCLEGRNINDVDKIILTASGGPFLKKSIRNVSKMDVLRHPVWNMGRKITVDSATMMNKALEIIEAHHLFGVPEEKIKVIIHPEAICHSLVQFIDGTILGQFSRPDMKLPIQYALTTPERVVSLVQPIELDKIRQLNFLTPDYKKFPSINFAYQALRIGKSMPAVLNGANEAAVKAFLSDELKFEEIPWVIKKAMQYHKPFAGGIDGYLRAEIWARDFVQRAIRNKGVM